ncbi:F-box protein At3g07870-like [Magnolia sinica]|uniref:F-box protein At3g07870-like n=1 Tax=Magnolia sinica TaxID=86752 RepID=UPI00265A9185|nr:F-box protein At3g07870-like [Magnolia sinica]
MEKLPNEVLVNILSRLSIKTLFQCIRVCITWRNIILHDPYFANMHLSTRSTQDNLPCLVFKTCSSQLCELCVVDFNSDNQDHISTGPISLRVDPGFKFTTILSCNGLLCLCENENSNPIYVCNPVTGYHVALPRLSERTDCQFIPGFGFDAVNNEYKVIRIMYGKRYNPAFQHEAEVYTLGSGAWRSIGSVPYRITVLWWSFIQYVNVHGALHWMTERIFNPTYPELIVAWDVRDEKFRGVPVPLEFGPNKVCKRMSLRSYNNCLSIVDFEDSRDFPKVWIMKDYNIKESWTKQVKRNMAAEYWTNEMRKMGPSTKEVSIWQYQWYRRGDELKRNANKDIHVKAVYDGEERRFTRVQITRRVEVEVHGFVHVFSTSELVTNTPTHVGSFISINGANQ